MTLIIPLGLIMKRFVIILLVMSIACAACNDDRRLGNGYFLLPKYEAIDIGYPNGEAILYRSTEEYLFDDIIIAGDVTEVNHNSKFIVAKRNPHNDRGTNSGQVEYYLILKEKDSLIGPLDAIAFEHVKERFQVELELK